MAPISGKKPVKNTKGATKKELTVAKEKIMKIKRDIVKIVEMMLEKDISKEWFLQNCGLLCQDDYQDVVQERSIERLCGYPLCNKLIEKVFKQKYHISRAVNKVYDLTERKCFCSNECYKASNFLKTQLPQIPLYMRKTEEPVVIDLLQNCNNSGSAGEEIIFREIITTDDIEKVYSEDATNPNHLSDILQEDLKGCEEHLSELKITEKVFEKPYVFGGEDQNEVEETFETETLELNDQDRGDDEDEERELFLKYDNISMLSNKHMPIPCGTKKAVLISPLKASTVPQSKSVDLSVDVFNNIFQDWFTEDTMKYLLGEKELYSIKADLLFKTIIDSSSSAEKVAAAKTEYVNTCLIVDKIQKKHWIRSKKFMDLRRRLHKLHDDESSSSDEYDSECATVESESAKKSPEKVDTQSEGKVKAVTFACDVNAGKASEEGNAEETLSEPGFPLMESVSQDGLRRNILKTNLKTVFFDILPFIDLHYKNIQDGVNKIIETFSLTPTNITYKPKEFKIIALVIFRILTQTTLMRDLKNANFSKLCEESISHLNISAEDIENLASDLISKEQVKRLQESCTISKT